MEIQRSLSKCSDRWFRIPLRARNHPEQSAWYLSPAQHNIVPAGRRSYKTERAKRKLITGTPHHPGALAIERGRFFAAAPTRDQAKQVFWQDLKDLTAPFQRREPSESELTIWLVTGSEIHVVGLDKPHRIEGRMWHGGIIDEYADTKPGTWEEHIEPVTVDTGAWIDLIGVPDYAGSNAEEYKKKFDAGLSRTGRFWSFTWPSWDVIDESILAPIRETTSENAYRQEYGAEWVSAPGRAYDAFRRDLDVSKERLEIDMMTPLRVWCDFNFLHHVWGMGQMLERADGSIRRVILREVYRQSATVEVMCLALKDLLATLSERYRVEPGMLHFYGDYAGTQRQATATWTAWQTIKREFPWVPSECWHYRPNPAISDRVHETNSWFCTASGDRRTVIDPSCTQHIDDFEYVTLKQLHNQDKGGKRTHASDGWGYFLMQSKPDTGYNFSESDYANIANAVGL